MTILTTKAEFRARQSFASATILGRIGNQKNWNAVVQLRKRTARWANMSFSVYVYYSDLHLRGYSESATNIPYPRRVLYKLNVKPKTDKQIKRMSQDASL